MKPTMRNAHWLVVALTFVVLGAQTVRKGMRAQGFDLDAYIQAGIAAMAGKTPYVIEGLAFPYIYSPFFACLMVPWSLLPKVVAIIAWYVLSMWSVLFLVQQAKCWIPNAGVASRWRGLAVVVLALGMFRLIHSNVVNGQVNLILIAMCVAFLIAERRGQHRRAGFWLALAVHTKALPILLLVYLLVRRRWAAIAWCAVFGVIFAVLPVVFWGGETIAFYEQYLSQLSTKIANGTIDNGALTIASSGEVEYFTLRGAVATLVPAASPSVVVKYVCLFVVVGGAAFVDWLLLRRRATACHAAAFSLYLAAALMISPISEKHHLALMFPAWLLGAVAVMRRPNDVATMVALVLAVACIWLAKPWPEGPWYFLSVCLGLVLAWRSCHRELGATSP